MNASATVEVGLSRAPAVFHRSPAAHVAGGLAAGFGAVLFAGFAIAMYAGVLIEDLAERVLYGSIPAFFALLMGASAVVAMRRGRDTRVAELAADGIWTPEMGHLAWSALAQVRLESTAGPAGARNAKVRRYRRLGLVPLDPNHRPKGAAGLAMILTQAYLGLIRRMAPNADLGDTNLAPFGISETELPKDFDRLVEIAREHVEVVTTSAAT